MKKILKSISLVSIMFSLLMVGYPGNIVQATNYTAVDVASHNTASDCWMIINGNVYNLTSFVSTHSGGSAVIIGQCGKDGTAVFNSGPHSSTTINAISSLMLGTLTATPTPTPTPTPTTLTLTSVTVVPTNPSVAIGGTTGLTVTPKDQNGGTVSGTTATYSSSNTAVATVDNSGTVTGISSGTATITVTEVSGSVTVLGTTSITIATLNPVLTSVTITPSSPIVKVGKTLQLITTPKDQSGIIFNGSTTTFASNDHLVATINSETGLITGVSAGSATITATTVSGSIIQTNTLTVNVTTKNPKLILANVTIAPINPSLTAGGTLQLSVTATDQNGTIIKKNKTTFASSNHNVALVNNKGGLIKGISAGTSIITITSSYKGTIITNNVIVTVTGTAPGALSTLASVSITPNTSSIDIGGVVSLSSINKDASGATLSGVKTRYISSNSAIAKVDNGGKVTGISSGTTTITVISSLENITVMNTANITVTSNVITPTPVITPPTTVKENDNDSDDDDSNEQIKTSSNLRNKIFKSENNKTENHERNDD